MDLVVDWLHLILRWLHVIFGAAWIGTSFYFNWLNHSIRPPEPPREGIKGQLFAVHGGAFYQVSKYAGAPAKLPDTLHWFKWEAYLTWISGVSLLAVVYYLNADMNLIDPSIMALTAGQAIGISIGSLVGGWFLYDGMCRSPLRHKPVLFAVIGFGLMTTAAWGLCQVFGSRAAYIHVGAILGTMMAANVFRVIIPNQRIMVDAMINGEEPDTSLGEAGALRSLHNNYITLPVLFIMVSNHYPMTYGHEWNWAVLAVIALVGAGTRHYFNLKSRGEQSVWILPVAALAMVALAFVTRPQAAVIPHGGSASVTWSDVESIVVQRCQSCHAETPTYPGFVEAPQGAIFDSPERFRAYRTKILQMVVDSHIMPPGNLTSITDEERAMIGVWLRQEEG